MHAPDDVFVQWTAGTTARFLTIAHPVAGTPQPDLSPVAMLGGFPIALTPSGTFLGDDQVSPFIGVFSSPAFPTWHRDILNRLGVPAVYERTVFANIGGPSALAAMVALDSSTGKTVWEFAPAGVPSEPVAAISGLRREAFGRLEESEFRAQLEASLAPLGGRGGVPTNVGTPVRVFKSSTPAIDAAHGHWTNPGLVATGGRVFGQVLGSIMSLSQESGKSEWRFNLRESENAHSIAATQDLLFVSLPTRLLALSLKSGELVWSEPTKRGGGRSRSAEEWCSSRWVQGSPTRMGAS